MMRDRAAVLEAPGAFTMKDIKDLAVPEGWAVLRVSFTGICGSDFGIVDGVHPRANLPLVLGHEITGTVEDAGAGHIPAGSLAAVNPLLQCGTCGPCRRGLDHICQNLRLLGIDAPGSLATRVAVPAASLHPFRDGVDPVEAALAEPLAVAVHAVRRAAITPGEKVLVFGAGPIGLLVALVAQHEGASSVTLVEPSSPRREAALALGFSAIPPDAVPASGDSDDAPSVVFDCAGHHSVAAQLPLVSPARGKIVIVAVYHGPVPFDLRELAFAEQEVIGVRVYAPEDFAASVRLIESGALGLNRIPVAILPLEQVGSAVELARTSGASVKILVQSN